MKMKKRRMEHFLFYDYTGIEHHLEEMAKKGWQLQNINSFFWTYEQRQPADMIYKVVYCPDASDFNPSLQGCQISLHQDFLNHGYTFAASWAQMQIFACPADNPERFFIDDLPEYTPERRLSTIHKSMKKNFLPGSIVILLLTALQVSMQLADIRKNPVRGLSSPGPMVIILLFLGLALFTVFSLTHYYSWFRKSEDAVSRGMALVENRSYPKLSKGLFLFTIGLVIYYFLSFTSPRKAVITAASFLIMAVLIAALHLIRYLLRKTNASRAVNIGVTLAAAFALSFLLTGGFTFLIASGTRHGFFQDKASSLPLKAEELISTDYSQYSYEMEKTSSPLLSRYECSQDAYPDNAPTIFYEVIKVKLPSLYDFCFREFFTEFDYRNRFSEGQVRAEYVQMESEGDLQIYRLHYGEPQNIYLICRDPFIAKIVLSWEADREQLERAASILFSDENF